MGDDFEKDLNDEVYEDDYYEENYNEEELMDSEDFSEDYLDDDDLYIDSEERKVHISYACEDCDYRWDDVLVKKRHNFDDDLERDIICPMCGSINITLI